MPSSLRIWLDIELIPGPTKEATWMAALAMVVSHRDGAHYTPEYVAARAGVSTSPACDWIYVETALAVWELVLQGTTGATPDKWAALLCRYGPIWLVDRSNLRRSVVVTGISGNGVPEHTFVTLCNPSPPGQGAIEHKTFLELDYEFGLWASNMQIAYASPTSAPRKGPRPVKRTGVPDRQGCDRPG